MSIKKKYKIYRRLALFVALNLMLDIFYPSVTYALTGGPSQPEVQSFEPVGTTEMVDLFTGDFTYNIPLFELPGPNGGYPFNLSYHSGITMDQEASWTGLGWNLNPGVINRQMRGLPDDFKGEFIEKIEDIKPNQTFGVRGTTEIEIFGANDNIGNATAEVGLGVYYNNYRGIGYNLSFSQSVPFHKEMGQDLTNGVGFGGSLTLDSQEGLSFSPSISVSSKTKTNGLGFNLGANYSSRRGLTDIFGGGSLIIEQTKNNKLASVTTRGVPSRLGFAATSYTPTISQEMSGHNLSVQYSLGGDLSGVYSNIGGNGYFTTQKLKNAGRKVLKDGYGYLYMQDANTKSVTDFNREKDGLVRSRMPYLAMPNLTYDIYSVSGQGTGGMYRPFRHDVGMIHDQEMVSKIKGGAYGAEAGTGTAIHIGLNASINSSKSRSGKWENGNNLVNTYAFVDGIGGDDNDLFKPYSFKSYGEHTSKPTNYLDYIGGEDPVAVKLVGDNAFPVLIDEYGGDVRTLTANDGKRNERTAANMSIQDYNNEVINTGLLPLFNVEYEEIGTTNTHTLTRTNKPHYTGGFIATNPNGLRYVYGLPAYNISQEEYVFSVPEGEADACAGTVNSAYSLPGNYKVENTDQYFSKTKLPEYAHSYLLTSIVGPDYIDADGVPGPSEGDLGYWVKFNYGKAPEYNWRVPFEKANYNRGSGGTIADDKGSFLFGTKELWYLKSAETKTHISIFELSERHDGKGVASPINDDGTMSGSQYKIDKISLYTRDEYTSGSTPEPIKEVHFEYNYALCPHVKNNDGTPYDGDGDGSLDDNQGGKLTLKKVYFTYGFNKRGKLSPYEFNYHEDNAAYNPKYDMYRVDRWGSYRPSTACENERFPYVDQLTSKENRDIYASAWHLRRIQLPSGGKIEVEYESDDYAYVQDKDAMQMMKIAGVGGLGLFEFPTDNPSSELLRVYFELQNTTDYSGDQAESTYKQKLEKDYLNGQRKLYYNLEAPLRKYTERFRDYVKGYADISDWGVHSYKHTVDGEEYYKYGYIELHQGKLKNGRKYHPFNLAIMQHLRINNPDLIQIGVSFDDSKSLSDAQKAAKVKSLVSMVATVRQVFSGFYTYAFNKNWGRRIDPMSYIRLKNPIQKKYGGGNRVKSIVMNDGWDTMTSNAEASGEYGQVYTYETEDGHSSGVAAYEPMIGGDEIPHRLPKEFPEETTLKTPNNLFFEEPFNEQFFPSPQVGYGRVVVKSIALDKLQRGTIAQPVGTSGSSEHAFYTAKEYPVITKATQLRKVSGDNVAKTMDVRKNVLPLPFLGTITTNKITASQGYSIMLNDMHGKPKKVTNYAHDIHGEKAQEVSSVAYIYRDTEEVINGKNIRVLDNIVPVIEGENYSSDVVKTQKMVGVDYDFFTDMRETETVSSDGGVSLNTEIILAGPIPIPTLIPWPNVGRTTDRVRLSVTNKIIHKSGILEKIVANNEGSKVETENLCYDALTGKPVLTTVNNNYDDKVYSYTLPAHWDYKEMGPAYENIGMSFKLTNTYSNNQGKFLIPKTDFSADIVDRLHPGDEFIVGGSTPIKIIYGGESTHSSLPKNMVFWSDNTTVDLYDEAPLLLTRSGSRNLLNVDMTNVTALEDPTISRVQDNCSYDVNYIDETQDVKYVVNYPCFESVTESMNILLDVNPADPYPEFQPVFDNSTGTVYRAIKKGTVANIAGTPQDDYIEDGDVEINEVWKHYTKTNRFSLATEGVDCSGKWTCSADNRLQFCMGTAKDDPDANNLLKNSFRVTFNNGKYNHHLYADNIIPNDRSLDCARSDAENYLYFESSDFPPLHVNYRGVLNQSTPGFAMDADGYATIDGQRIKYFDGGGYIQLLCSGCTTYVVNADGGVLDESGNTITYLRKVEYFNFVPFTEIETIGTFYVDQSHPDWTDDLDELDMMYADITMKNGNGYPDQIQATIRLEGATENLDWKKATNIPVLTGENTGTVTNAIVKTNGVLNMTAQSFSDNWNQDFYDAKAVSSDLRDKNPYSNGQKGIWRGKETYTYVADRNQSTNPNLKEDGDMDYVAIFNHTVANFDACVPAWRKVNEITKYSPYGYDVENRDVLGRYATANYSNYGENASAVAQNTSYRELGYEDFETYDLGYVRNQHAKQSSNLQFHNTTVSDYKYKTADILMAKGNVVIIDMPYDPQLTIDQVSLEGHYLNDKVSGSFYNTFDVIDYQAHPDQTTKSIIQLSKPPEIDANVFWQGAVNIPMNLVSYQDATHKLAVVNNTKAHTGKKSIYIEDGGSNNHYPQNDLNLQTGRKYVISAWISQDNEQVPTYFTGTTPSSNHVGMQVNYVNSSGAIVRSTPLMTPTGPIIEGWQKVEGTFSLHSGESAIVLSLRTQAGLRTYFDDIRVFPFTGNMESYVYNKVDNTLRDILDNNNYATHYDYDDERNLFLIKKETYEGMKTIQETRTHRKQ